MPALTPEENALAAEAYLTAAGEIAERDGYHDPRVGFFLGNATVHAILATRPPSPWTLYASSFDVSEPAGSVPGYEQEADVRPGDPPSR